MRQFLYKTIIGFKPIKYSSFWWWYRLISHKGFHFDDYHIWSSFWSSLNRGYVDMEYKYQFEKFWGKGSYPPERIVLSERDYDALQKRLSEPPKYNERLAEILRRTPPWERTDD